MTTIDGKSPNLAHETTATIHDLLMEPAIRERLAQICPDAFCDGDLQMDLLLEAMGKYHTTEDIKELVVDENERYEFRWSGKQKAKYESQKSSTGTLRPCPEESKNWDTTQNLYIEGDNLEVLKILKRAYAGKIKMIYIDPPYNTGKDFVYKDDYTDNLKNYLEQTGQLTAEGKAKSSNTAADGRFHTNWLNMMYPRLRLARELLSDDGVIFISIDDHEVENLKKICDEVFLNTNFIAQLVWERAFAPKNDAKFISNSHDYVMMYSKDITKFVIGRLDRTEEANSRYINPDNDPRGVWTSGDISVKTYNKLTDYPIQLPSGRIVNPPSGGCWRLSKETFNEYLKENRIWFGINGDNTPRIKRFLSELKFDGMAPTSILFYKDVGHSQEGAKELVALMNNGIFDGPKPVRLMQRLITLANLKSDSIFLDFFSGSASSAHGLFSNNIYKNKNCKFIMVQLPEDADDRAKNAGYKNICEIGKERIRRAGEMIIEDAKKAGKDVSNLDVGFKVFKLSESNMNKWHLELADLKDKNEMEKAAIAALRAGKNTIRRKEIESENTKRKVAGLAPFDIDLCVIYEWLLKYGVMPDCRITTAQIGGHKVYSVSGGAFMICLEHALNRDWAKALVAYRDECLSGMDEATKSDAWHVMVADECFADTRDMQNVAKTLHDNGLKDEHWIVV